MSDPDEERRYVRDHHWGRPKEYREKWPRFCAEVPPELAEQLDAAHKKALGINRSAFSRAGIVRTALHLYLEQIDPLPEDALEGTATEVPVNDELADRLS